MTYNDRWWLSFGFGFLTGIVLVAAFLWHLTIPLSALGFALFTVIFVIGFACSFFLAILRFLNGPKDDDHPVLTGGAWGYVAFCMLVFASLGMLVTFLS